MTSPGFAFLGTAVYTLARVAGVKRGRGRGSGKGEFVRGRARGAREGESKGTRSPPPSSLARGLAPQFPFPFLSNACHAGYLHPSLEGERKICRGVFTSSLRRRMRECHVVVVCRRQRKYEKCAARAKLF